MIRYAALIKFKPGASKADAERFIKDMVTEVGTIAQDPRNPAWKYNGRTWPAFNGVHEYDDATGEPTLYILPP